jgi:hypothetical protein
MRYHTKQGPIIARRAGNGHRHYHEQTADRAPSARRHREPSRPQRRCATDIDEHLGQAIGAATTHEIAMRSNATYGHGADALDRRHSDGDSQSDVT